MRNAMLNAVNRRVMEGLVSDGHAELRNLRVESSESGRVVILRGRVSSYYLKQRAQEVAKLVNGAVHLVNAIEVAQEPPLSCVSTTQFEGRRQDGGPLGGSSGKG